MTTNPYLKHAFNTKEQIDLDESLVIEAIQFHGTDVVYLPRKWAVVDHVIGEITASSFDKGHEIEMVLEGVENLVNSAIIMDKIGLGAVGGMNAKAFVSKKRFAQEVPAEELSSPGRPCEGDIIFLRQAGILLEIRSVEPEPPLRSNGRLHVYELSIDLFRYSAEDINDGLDGALFDLDGVPDPLRADDFEEKQSTPTRVVEYGDTVVKDMIAGEDVFSQGGRED